MFCIVPQYVTQLSVPSINIRQLRDTRRLKAWLRAGKTVELCERRDVIARIVPAQVDAKPENWPDFGGRRRKIFGDQRVPGADIVIEERGRF
jgi:antitoxin (DNA-binding transcriptional repressor) of toxin-antitoxin stability system